jgi:hypothetical protein
MGCTYLQLFKGPGYLSISPLDNCSFDQDVHTVIVKREICVATIL